MMEALGYIEKFYKKGLFSPAMLLVSGDSVRGGDKTYLIDDPEIMRILSNKNIEGKAVKIQYNHLNVDKDVRAIKNIRILAHY